MMRPSTRAARLAVLVGLAAGQLALTGCGRTVQPQPPPAASWDLPGDLPGGPPPRTAAAPAAPSAPAEESSASPTLPPLAAAPAATVPPEALAALASDPEAQRFLLLERLARDGLVGPDDHERRRAANLGALLPFSAPPPAAGLEAPLPDPDALFARIAQLVRGDGGPASARTAERAFLLDTLLPARPRAAAPPVRTDAEALRQGRERIDRLAAAGLVTQGERERELASIAGAELALASAPPPPPPEPPKPPPRKKAKAAPVPAGPMGLHLLSMAAPTMAPKAAEALKKEFPELVPLGFRTLETVIPDLGTTHRLVFGPLPGPEADRLCAALRAKGQSCTLVKMDKTEK